MTLLFIIISITIVIDFIMLLLFPQFYSYIGIPIKTITVSGYGIRTMSAVKAGFLSNFNTFKFWNDDNCIWFRTKFNLLNIYTIGFLSITKGIIVKEGDKYKCSHVMNLSTCLFILLFSITPFFVAIDSLGIVFLILISIGLVGFTLYRNKQFNEMIKFIEIK